jgi:two-component system NtrC family response regulator
VVIDCTTLPETLVESILFGHVKGAFTGAAKDRIGLIREADGGTLFLDEVGELPLNSQSSFLRVLQERKFRPVGTTREVSSNFRLIAASNKDLYSMVNDGKFRNDLFFRLKSFTIHLPPLKDRLSDIPDLTSYFVSVFCKLYGIGTKGVSQDYLEILCSYPWPGNIRELANVVESTVACAKDESMLFPVHLPTDIRSRLARASVEKRSLFEKSTGRLDKIDPSAKPIPRLRQLIDSVEKKYLIDLIVATEGNITEICRISGMSRANVYNRLKKHQIKRKFSDPDDTV